MRVAIVNDTLMAVESLRRVLVEAGCYQIAWIARDGVEAVDFCNKDTPDLLLMDLIMPVMDGVDATRLIMASSPCPVLIVTSSVSKHASRVFSAMGYGALDAVNTPILGGVGSAPGKDAFLAKIASIAKLRNINNQAIPQYLDRQPKTAKNTRIKSSEHLIAIGSSSGGPQALNEILRTLPATFSFPIVIIQHIDPHFSADLGKWLDKNCALSVKIAKCGDHPQPGTVLMGGKDEHLVFNRVGSLMYTADPIEESYRPSVNVFFQSVSKYWQGDVTALLLTGMGRDGAQGLLGLKEKGFYTIAQDEETSAVYGMPKAAADLNAAVDILPLDEISNKLIALH